MAVSMMLSPLATEELLASLIGMTWPPSRCMAAMNEHDVRVDGS